MSEPAPRPLRPGQRPKTFEPTHAMFDSYSGEWFLVRSAGHDSFGNRQYSNRAGHEWSMTGCIRVRALGPFV